VIEFSQYKGVHINLGTSYTIKSKSYIIHTFSFKDIKKKKYLKTGNNYEVYINTIQAKGHIEHALSDQKEILKENTIDK
jgi:hypothetical protein